MLVTLAAVDPEHRPWIALGLAVVALLLLMVWKRQFGRRRLLQDVPTSKVKGVAIGLCEVKGAARLTPPLVSYLAAADCVWYRWSVEEHWRRTVTETYRDKDGKTRTRTRVESGWKTVASDEVRVSFFVEDDTGAIRVDPTRGRMEGATVFSDTVGRGDALYYGKGPRRAVRDSTHRRRFVEHAIPIDASLFVMGSCRMREDAPKPEIAYDRDDGWLLITMRSEAEVQSGYGLGANVALVAGGLFAAGAALPFTPPGVEEPMEMLTVMSPWMGVGLLVFIGAAGVLFAVMLYNGLVRVLNRMHQAWSLIDVQLQRRAALIPRLAEVVRAYATHERATQEQAGAYRGQAFRASGRPVARDAVDRAAAATDAQTDALGRLLIVAESYPELKADQLYGQLQAELVDTEDCIALARSFYNASVQAYNDRLLVWPDVWIARAFGYRPGAWYEVRPFERDAVKVDLDGADKRQT